MTHLLGHHGLHHSSEAKCGGSRGSNTWGRCRPLNNRKTTGAQGKAHLGGKKFYLPHQAPSLPLETSTSPADLTHFIELYLLSPINGYKEKYITSRSLFRTFLKDWEIKREKVSLKSRLWSWRMVWHYPGISCKIIPKKDTQNEGGLVVADMSIGISSAQLHSFSPSIFEIELWPEDLLSPRRGRKTTD